MCNFKNGNNKDPICGTKMVAKYQSMNTKYVFKIYFPYIYNFIYL